jgi:hypothetical protein
MTASENSFVGLAKQNAKSDDGGFSAPLDADFDYFLFTQGGIAPNNRYLPLDQEVGGGALLRGLTKVGVVSAGAFEFIPRPLTLGWFLLGALGNAGAATLAGATSAYTHAFTLGADQFAAPYFSFRSAPGNLWGEEFRDVRIANLALTWKAADYLRASMSLMGGTPTPDVDTSGWNALSAVDGGPQFLAPITTIELPTGTAVKVLGGSVVMGLAIPLDEQWITGSYEPDDFDINSRSFTISLNVKVDDKALYEKMMYDPAQGGAWAAEVFREANFTLEFLSDQEAETGYPFGLSIEANGQSGDSANVIWSATPAGMAAGKQVTMNLTGTFVADPLAGDPITATLTNTKATDYA